MHRREPGITAATSHLRKPRDLFAALAVACALAAVALPGAALAAENSWRYLDGRPVSTLDGADGAVTALATDYSHWELRSGCWQTTYHGQWTTVGGPFSFGVDVSHWNGAIDWAAAKRDGVDFAILRCSHGLNPSDRDDLTFRDNVQGCKANGIPFGVYHYSCARTVDEAREEADHVLWLLEGAGVVPGDLGYPVFYDLEENGMASTANRGLLASMADAFCSRIEAAGYSAGVYANQYWWSAFLTDPVFDRWERWVANWNYRGAGCRLDFGRPFTMWQFMSTGWVDGIGLADIDFDYRLRPNNNPSIPETDDGPGFVYRLYNRLSGEHLMTAQRSEALDLWANGWRYEGRAWTEPTESGVPIYRLYNPYTHEHLYTTSEEEYESLDSIGWEGEDAKLKGADVTARPVYRLRNPYVDGPGTHHYTLDEGERDSLLELGWEDEGIGWYALS